MTAGKPTIPEVADRFSFYGERNPGWGSLHIVMEDGNVSDKDVHWCLEYAQEVGDADGAALAAILLTMSRTQRKKLPSAL